MAVSVELIMNLPRCKRAIIIPALALLPAALLSMLMFSSPASAVDVNGDFALDLKVNGRDMLASQSFTIMPDETLVFKMTVSDIRQPIEMKSLSIEIFFAGIPVSAIAQELNQTINPGDTYQPEIAPVNARDYLSIWGINISTGKYKAIVKLEYDSAGSLKTWTQSREVEVPGNPMTTVAGVAAAVITGIVLGGIISLFKSLAGVSLETQALTGKKSLEAQARSKVSGSLVSAVKKVIIKDRCPVCQGVIKHGHCTSCRRSVKELQRLYRRRIHDLAAAGMKMLASGEVKSEKDLTQKLGISGILANDVMAVIQNARLFEVKRAGRSFLASALMTGISSAIAGVLWVTIGGLAALNTSALVTILVLSIVLPVIIAGGMNMQMRRRLARNLLSSSTQSPE
jgi:hypothetical protein